MQLQTSSRSDHNPKANIHSTCPRWPGFKRQNFINKERWWGLSAGRPNRLTRGDILSTTQLGPKEAAQAFLRAVWAEPGAWADELFSFPPHYTFINNKSRKASAPLSQHPSHTIKYSEHTNTHTHAHNFEVECFLSFLFCIQINYIKSP